MEEYIRNAKAEADLAQSPMASAQMMRRVTVRVPIMVQASLHELNKNPSLTQFHIPPNARVLPRDHSMEWDTDNIIVENSVMRKITTNTFPFDLGFTCNFLPTGYHDDDRKRQIETVEGMLTGRGSATSFSACVGEGQVDPDVSVRLLTSKPNRLNGHWVVATFGCFADGDELARGTVQLERNVCQNMGLPAPPNIENDPMQTWVLCREPHIQTWMCRAEQSNIRAMQMGVLRFGDNDEGYWLVDYRTVMNNLKLFWSMAVSKIDHRRVQDLSLTMQPRTGVNWCAGIDPDSPEAHEVRCIKFTWIISYMIFPLGAHKVAVPTMTRDMPDVDSVLRASAK